MFAEPILGGVVLDRSLVYEVVRPVELDREDRHVVAGNEEVEVRSREVVELAPGKVVVALLLDRVAEFDFREYAVALPRQPPAEDRVDLGLSAMEDRLLLHASEG